jgi:hypothetical protein
LRRSKLPLLLALAALLPGIALGGKASPGAEAAASIECEGDSCQVLPPPPEEPVIGTEFLTPEVNPPPEYRKPAGKQRKKHRHGVRGGRR